MLVYSMCFTKFKKTQFDTVYETNNSSFNEDDHNMKYIKSSKIFINSKCYIPILEDESPTISNTPITKPIPKNPRPDTPIPNIINMPNMIQSPILSPKPSRPLTSRPLTPIPGFIKNNKNNYINDDTLKYIDENEVYQYNDVFLPDINENEELWESYKDRRLNSKKWLKNNSKFNFNKKEVNKYLKNLYTYSHTYYKYHATLV